MTNENESLKYGNLTRAELRRLSREAESGKSVINITRDKLNEMLKKEHDKAVEDTLIIMLGIPAIIMADKMGIKDKNELQEFFNAITVYYKNIEEGEITIGDIIEAIKDELGATIVREGDKSWSW